MGTRRGELILTILRFLKEVLPDLGCYCKALLATPGSLAAEIEGNISVAMLFIPDSPLMNVVRFLPTSASLLATLVESFTSLATMGTSPFSIGFVITIIIVRSVRIVITIRRGWAIIHPGSALHGALPIASGARTNLLLFLR